MRGDQLPAVGHRRHQARDLERRGRQRALANRQHLCIDRTPRAPFRVADRVGRGQVAGRFVRQIDARGPAEAEPVGPVDQSGRAQLLGMMKEVHVAAYGQGPGKVYLAVAAAVSHVDLAALLIGMAKISLAHERRLRIHVAGLQQGDGRQGFEHRAGRNRHAADAVE